jgi:hypothetical protein
MNLPPKKERTDESKSWIGLANPCYKEDHKLFVAATFVTIDNRLKAKFWTSPWLGGLCPADLAPGLFKLSKRKNYNIEKALDNNFWVNQINTSQEFGLVHIEEFVKLWELLNDVHLENDVPDTIYWKFRNNRKESASSAYKMQFEGLVSTTLNASNWKVWASPKWKFFTLLVGQDRVWTADRLQQRVGKIVEIIHFATKFKNQERTFRTNVGSPLECGNKFFHGVQFMIDHQGIGPMNLPSMVVKDCSWKRDQEKSFGAYDHAQLLGDLEGM